MESKMIEHIARVVARDEALRWGVGKSNDPPSECYCMNNGDPCDFCLEVYEMEKVITEAVKEIE